MDGSYKHKTLTQKASVCVPCETKKEKKWRTNISDISHVRTYLNPNHDVPNQMTVSQHKYMFLIVTMATNVWFAAHISGLGSYWQTTYPLVDVLVRTFRGRWKHSYMSCWESLEKYLFCSFWYEDWTWTYQEILLELWTSCHCSTTKEMKKEWFDIKLDFKKMSCKSKAVQGWNTVCDVFTVRCNNRGHWPA